MLEQTKQVYEQIKDHDMPNVGRTGMTVLTMALSTIPGVGGLLATVSADAREGLFSPDLAGHIKAISSDLLALKPELDEIPDLSERVQKIEALLADNDELALRLAAAVAPKLDTQEFVTVGGEAEIRDTIYRNLHLHSTASEGGHVLIDHVAHTGSAKFVTGPGSKHVIQGSEFSGSSGSGVGHQALFRSAEVRAGAELQFNPPGEHTTLKVNYRPGPKGGAAMTITPNGVFFGGEGEND